MVIICVMKTVLVLALSLFLAGCTTVAPFEKEQLAQPAMQRDANNPRKVELREHIFYSKEASKGGAMITSGGCGCN